MSRIASALGAFAALLLATCGPAVGDPNSTATQPPSLSSATASATGIPLATSSASPVPTRTPRPSIVLGADGIPRGAVGPLLLVQTLVGDDLSFGPGSPSPEISVWDVGAGEELSRIWIGEPVRQPQASFLAGHHIVVSFGDALWRYTLDGKRERLLRAPDDSFIAGIAVDSTGDTVVAAIQESLGAPVNLRWIDVTTGALLREVDALGFDGVGDPLPLVSGGPNQPLLLRGVTYSERPGGIAVLEPNGLVRTLSVSGFATPSPDGRLVAHGPEGRCETVAGSRIEITDSATAEVVVSYEDPSVNLHAVGWSPDGTEFAIRALPFLDSGPCSDPRAEPGWLVLALDGSVRPVSSDLDLSAAWHGARAVTFGCGDQLDAGWVSSFDRLLRPNSCGRFDIEVRIGDRSLGLQQNPTILGWIDLE